MQWYRFSNIDGNLQVEQLVVMHYKFSNIEKGWVSIAQSAYYLEQFSDSFQLAQSMSLLFSLVQSKHYRLQLRQMRDK